MYINLNNAMTLLRSIETKRLENYPYLVYRDQNGTVRKIYPNLQIDPRPVLKFIKVPYEQGKLEGDIYLAFDGNERKFVIKCNFINDPPYCLEEGGEKLMTAEELEEYLKDAAIILSED